MEELYNQTMKLNMRETQLTQTDPLMEQKYFEEQKLRLDKTNTSMVSDVQTLNGTVHHPSTRELLNKQVDQIAELKYKIAEL